MKQSKTITFTKEKVVVFSKFTNEMLFELSQADDDFIQNKMTGRLSAHILSNISEERILTYYCPKPSFLDWLFGKTKKVEFELKVKDLLLNPLKLKETERIYIVELKD